MRPICRPGHEQRLVYNGHKRVHALKFQSTSLCNGIIANLFGPVDMSKLAFYISATCNSMSPPFVNSSHFIVNDLQSSTVIFVLECETLVAHIDLHMITFIFRRKMHDAAMLAESGFLQDLRDWSKSIGGGGVGRSREGVGPEVLSLVQGVGRAIFSYP